MQDYSLVNLVLEGFSDLELSKLSKHFSIES
jgi:hypothetical protein